MLEDPTLARCGRRTLRPPVHPTSGEPAEWFSPQQLEAAGLSGMSFDFFVNWNSSPPSLTPVIWIKKILKPPHTYQKLAENLPLVLAQEMGEPSIRLLLSFTKAYSLELQLLIFRDDQDWADANSSVLLCTMEEAGDTFSVDSEEIPIDVLQQLIRLHSGGAVKIGQKGLFYGTSSLECFLSTTDSLYPGDIDLLVLDSTGKPAAILEYKKHTLSTPIGEQKISNYYPRPDGRKYNRLFVLQDYLASRSQQTNIPFFIIYYPTAPAATEGRIELIKGKYGQLCTMAARNFSLPREKTKAAFEEITELLKRGIAYYHREEKAG